MNRAEPYRLSGPLTSAEVPAIYAASLAWKKSGLPSAIDLEAVEQADSSGIALLLEWLSWSRQEDVPLAFSNPPEGLRIIASLSQADRLLGWEAAQS